MEDQRIGHGVETWSQRGAGDHDAPPSMLNLNRKPSDRPSQHAYGVRRVFASEAKLDDVK